MAGGCRLRPLLLLLVVDRTRPQLFNFGQDLPAYSAPSPPVVSNETVIEPFNTSVSFFNVGACQVVGAVKFEVKAYGPADDPVETECPLIYRVGKRCHVPGPYGRQVYVRFIGRVEHLDITLLNPAEDDVNLTTPERVYLSTDQRRNFVGVYLKTGTTTAGCGNGFTVLPPSETGAGEIAPRYFRTMLRHAAMDVGSADVVSNGDSTVATLAQGEASAIDQLIVTAEDMPTAIGIQFVTSSGAVASYALPETPRLWGSTCERAATGYVLFGRPSANLPLRVLRLDGTEEECEYDEATTSKFLAEVAFYHAVATPQSLTFAFGLSPFLPYSTLQTSKALLWTATDAGVSLQPGELWVKVVDGVTGGVVVQSQRVPIADQRRNLVGVSKTGECSTCFKLDLLQADNATHTEPTVPPAHFRLLFTHAALTLPPATIRANDDIELFEVLPGARGYLDHPLLAPHQSGRLLKVSFDTGGHSSNSFATLLDISRLCDGAAYAVVLTGTLDRLDSYDPILVAVSGTPTACSLSAASTSAGTSSSLALLNAAPHASSRATMRFQWGQTLLSLTRSSVPLAYRDVEVTDVPVGTLFVRLVQPHPPYAPLTPIQQLTVHKQSRNALSVLVPGYDYGFEAVEYSVDAGMSVRFSDASDDTALGDAAEIAFGEACAQSLQLVVVSGVRGVTATGIAGNDAGSDSSDAAAGNGAGGANGAAGTTTVQVDKRAAASQVVDAANGFCRLVIPTIPERAALEAATTQPPTTTTTLDIFGENGPGGGPFIQESAAGGRGGARDSVWLVVPLLVASTFSLLVRHGAAMP